MGRDVAPTIGLCLAVVLTGPVFARRLGVLHPLFRLARVDFPAGLLILPHGPLRDNPAIHAPLECRSVITLIKAP